MNGRDVRNFKPKCSHEIHIINLLQQLLRFCDNLKKITYMISMKLFCTINSSSGTVGEKLKYSGTFILILVEDT